jgi:hypothetical protein
MKTLLWVDDIRNPRDFPWFYFSPIGKDNVNVVWVKNFQETKDWIYENGLPDAVSFDHDLGDYIIENDEKRELTGLDCAKMMVQYCLDNALDVPKFNSHSSNPYGRDAIINYLENYHKFFSQNN